MIGAGDRRKPMTSEARQASGWPERYRRGGGSEPACSEAKRCRLASAPIHSLGVRAAVRVGPRPSPPSRLSSRPSSRDPSCYTPRARAGQCEGAANALSGMFACSVRCSPPPRRGLPPSACRPEHVAGAPGVQRRQPFLRSTSKRRIRTTPILLAVCGTMGPGSTAGMTTECWVGGGGQPAPPQPRRMMGWRRGLALDAATTSREGERRRPTRTARHRV